jgi:hypothetical protein
MFLENASMDMLTDSVPLQKIRTWFYNHYDHPYRELIKFTRRWSARNAFYHENKADITELTQKMSGGAPGSQAFLGALQNATTSLWNKVSDEEREQYEDIAKEWSEDRPLKHIQAKYVTSHISKFYPTNVSTYVSFQNGISSIQGPDSQGLSNTAVQNMWNAVCGSGSI